MNKPVSLLLIPPVLYQIVHRGLTKPLLYSTLFDDTLVYLEKDLGFESSLLESKTSKLLSTQLTLQMQETMLIK